MSSHVMGFLQEYLMYGSSHKKIAVEVKDASSSQPIISSSRGSRENHLVSTIDKLILSASLRVSQHARVRSWPLGGGLKAESHKLRH
jgi:hypothetical protein